MSALIITTSFTGWSVWSTHHRRAQVPQRDVWREAAERVKVEWRQGDRVTWYPTWAEEARLALHGLTPLRLPQRGEVDLGRASRLWVLGAFGYDGEHLTKNDDLKILQSLKILSQDLMQRQGSGPVSISLLSVENHRVMNDLVEDLRDADRIEVARRRLSTSKNSKLRDTPCDFWALSGWHCRPRSIKQRRDTLRCLQRPNAQKLKTRSKRRDLYTLDRRRWLPYVDCKLHPTEHVSQDWRVIGEHPRRCIWMAPHRGHEVTLRWTPQFNLNDTERSALPKTSERSSHARSKLWLSWGWEDLAIRHPFRASRAQKLAVKIERGIGVNWEQTLNPTWGWHTEQISLPPLPPVGPPAPISVKVSAPKGVSDAAFCIDLTVR